MGEFIDAVASWPTLLLVLLVFGFAPRLVLRVALLAFERDDPRRHELLAELHAVPRIQRPMWVAEQLEVALVEGLGGRIQWALTGRVIHRWSLGDGVERHSKHPDTFYLPSDEAKGLLRPGDDVKLMFEMKRDGGGDRMWVTIVEIGRHHFVGELNNWPVMVPKLVPGDTIKFRLRHIIDIAWREECVIEDPAEHDPTANSNATCDGEIRAGDNDVYDARSGPS